MDDTIEVCSGCGKMPRAIDSLSGSFICSRCGNKSTIFVTGSDYEKVVIGLDQKFHQNLQTKKIEEAANYPVDMTKKKLSKTTKKSKTTKSPKAKKPAKRKK